jgi:lycopene beta-cyclase
MKYDYIIAGSGCAGLSLLHALLHTPSLQNKSILVIDQDSKKSNDRTWCYWEKQPGLFEPIVHAQWNTLEFLTTDFKKELDLGAYTYKMIQGIDFYNFVLNTAKQCKNVTFVQETIFSIDAETTVVTTNKNSYTATYIFNSTPLFNPKITEKNSLLQHFKGWVIQTKEPVFDPKVGRLMDFSLAQENGATFMYVLPTSTTEALVEYTLFSPTLLNKDTYTIALEKYLKETLKIEEYTLLHEEFGVIPMSLAQFEKQASTAIINLGTAGGFTKASSGYTFQFIQKNVADIVQNLKAGKNPKQPNSFKDNVYQWYDRTLIDVLLTKKLTGKEVFTNIFQKVSAEKILAFLGNESTLIEDFTIMKSLPLIPFLTSGIQQLRIKKS